jgi:hypothetical protein
MSKIKDFVKRAFTKNPTKTLIEDKMLYEYDVKENREKTINYLYNYAKMKRAAQETKWKLYDDYYNNIHTTQIEVYQKCLDSNIPWLPAIVPDPYIHVESQINPDIPTFEFNGRDYGMDSEKAKQRQYVTQFILDNCHIETMNTENERELGKLGNAFWKVCYNPNIEKPGGIFGEIEIFNPKCEEIFSDPTATDLDDCEYIDYVYSVHKLRANRMFRNELKELDRTINSYGMNTGYLDSNILDSTRHDTADDTVMIIEHWFRQPYAGKDTIKIYINEPETGKPSIEEYPVEWESGDIACSIMINYKEIKYIPKFWLKTGKQNKMYPFVKYCKVPNVKQFWDRSDLEMIKDLVDATDRELAMALLNDTFMGNDIIVCEENAFADDNVPRNEPGSIWKMKDGKMGSVTRLQGLQGNMGAWDTIEKLRGLIQETVGNFDTAMGKEPIRVTTASGIAQLNEKADFRKNIKKADRTAGFERLFRLLDYMSLEFYDDNRIIYLGAKEEGKEPIVFQYNSDNMFETDNVTGKQYIPDVDVVVTASDPLSKSKSFTLASTENLFSKEITINNYKLVEAMVDIMNLPNRKDIKQVLTDTFEPQLKLQNMKIMAEIQAMQQPNVGISANVSPGQEENNYDDIVSGLSPEEQQEIMNNPDILINALEGG